MTILQDIVSASRPSMLERKGLKGVTGVTIHPTFQIPSPSRPTLSRPSRGRYIFSSSNIGAKHVFSHVTGLFSLCKSSFIDQKCDFFRLRRAISLYKSCEVSVTSVTPYSRDSVSVTPYAVTPFRKRSRKLCFSDLWNRWFSRVCVKTHQVPGYYF